jgi:hypothetical protein
MTKPKTAQQEDMRYITEHDGIIWFADKDGNPYGYAEGEGRTEDQMEWKGKLLICVAASEG